jgi:hypothetical protein
MGDSAPSNIAYAPAASIHVAPLAGSSRARASTNAALARASVRSSLRDSSRSENG